MGTRDEERVLLAIKDLTQQVSRLAWAQEVAFISSLPKEVLSVLLGGVCHQCGSQLVHRDAEICPACREPIMDKSDG